MDHARWKEVFYALHDCRSREHAVAILKSFCMPSSPLVVSVEASLLGNVDPINQYLFSNDRRALDEIVWIAQTETQRFVWMIGLVDPIEIEIKRVRTQLALNSELYRTGFTTKPPPARFIETIETSNWQRSSEMSMSSVSFSDDLKLFQVGYSGNDVREDVDQNFAINLNALQESSICAYRVAVTALNQNFRICLEGDVRPNHRFLTALHIELHNIGHFIGPWPFSNKTKGVFLYEAIEEFRACLAAACLFIQSSVGNSRLAEAFAVHILATRIFSYGLRSYQKIKRNRAEAREVMVACLFIDLLERCGHNCTPTDLIIEFKRTLEYIHSKEMNSLSHGTDGLREIARSTFRRIFPSGTYTEMMRALLSISTVEDPEFDG